MILARRRGSKKELKSRIEIRGKGKGIGREGGRKKEEIGRKGEGERRENERKKYLDLSI